MAKRLPPSCGLDLEKSLLYNPFQQAFQQARRLRYCLMCRRTGSMTGNGIYLCPVCQKKHLTNLTAPRLYQWFMLRAGRRSGKSLIGAHAAREELIIPDTKGWVCGPTFKVLHDATMPTLLRLIPPQWVSDWNQENLELTLINRSIVQFRSLDDPERGRGPGLNWLWLDEAAFIQERAWDVLRPALTENLGIAFATTSPAGYDWSYQRFMKPALIDHFPGFWACRYKTIDNPIFQTNAELRAEVDMARKTMPPKTFAAEYEGEDVNFQGAIYAELLESQLLLTDDAIKAFIPEWPAINADRPILVGLDSGSDHPFGAVLMVVTEKGAVAINEYLERNTATTLNLSNIRSKFRVDRFSNVKWAANKNEAALRLEAGLMHIGVIPAEAKHDVGIQRVQSWLYTKQLWFAASACPKTVEQFRSYAYADNFLSDGSKRDQERVFKYNDELPDCVRYAMMAWPELPKPREPLRTVMEQHRWDNLTDHQRRELEILHEFTKRQKQGRDLAEDERGYPISDFFVAEGER